MEFFCEHPGNLRFCDVKPCLSEICKTDRFGREELKAKLFKIYKTLPPAAARRIDAYLRLSRKGMDKAAVEFVALGVKNFGKLANHEKLIENACRLNEDVSRVSRFRNEYVTYDFYFKKLRDWLETNPDAAGDFPFLDGLKMEFVRDMGNFGDYYDYHGSSYIMAPWEFKTAPRLFALTGLKLWRMADGLKRRAAFSKTSKNLR
jgi:hypothetical protein